MTDEEKINAVTTALAGEFYVGQAVRVDDPRIGRGWKGREGTVHAIDSALYAQYTIAVDFGEGSDGEVIWFEPRSLKPL